MNKYVRRNVVRSLILFFLFSTSAMASELPAELVWSKRLVLSTTVTGVVDKVLVSPGQRLKAGTVLLSLDAREFKAARDQAAAKLLAAKTTYDEAKRETVRSQELFERTMISEHELQIEKNNEAQAKAQYLNAKAYLQQTDIALERSRILAPYDCLVLGVPVQPGQTILSNLQAEPLAVVAEADHMIARAWLSSAEVAKFSAMQAKQVTVSGRKFNIVSQTIAAEANNKGQYALEVLIQTAGASLRAGQAASIIFP